MDDSQKKKHVEELEVKKKHVSQKLEKTPKSISKQTQAMENGSRCRTVTVKLTISNR